MLWHSAHYNIGDEESLSQIWPEYSFILLREWFVFTGVLVWIKHGSHSVECVLVPYARNMEWLAWVYNVLYESWITGIVKCFLWSVAILKILWHAQQNWTSEYYQCCAYRGSSSTRQCFSVLVCENGWYGVLALWTVSFHIFMCTLVVHASVPLHWCPDESQN